MTEYLVDFLRDKKTTDGEKSHLAMKSLPPRPIGIPIKQPVKTDDSIKIMVPVKGRAPIEVIVQRFKVDSDKLLNHSIIFYGASGTGKTRLIKYILSFLTNIFPLMFIFAPTNAENHDYDGLVPKSMLFHNFVVNDIKKIYLRQKMATSTYHHVNNMDALKSLFDKLSSPRDRQLILKLNEARVIALNNLKSNPAGVDEYILRESINSVNEIYKYNLIRRYKSTIVEAYRRQRISDQFLSPEESRIIKYLNFNPHTLILFDDAMTELLEMIRQGKPKKGEQSGDGRVIKDFFIKGRHAKITHFYTFQDDAKLDPGIRRNAFYSIFTEENSANCWFGREANGIPKLERLKAEYVINAVFNSKLVPSDTKLVYSRNDRKYYYITIEERAPKMCSKMAWDYDANIGIKGEIHDEENPYFDDFNS